MNSWINVDGVAILVSGDRNPQLTYAVSTNGVSAETDTRLIQQVTEHVRHARRFHMPLGRIYR